MGQIHFTRHIQTNSTELSSSWEAISCSAIQEFHNILCNQKVLYHFDKNPPLVLILSQFNAVHTTPSYFSKPHLILSSHLGLCLSGFPNKIPYATWSTHSKLYLVKNTSYETHYTMFSNLVLFHPFSVQTVFSSAPCSQTPSVHVSPLMSNTKFHAHTKPPAKL
jgi:hypothetical protein